MLTGDLPVFSITLNLNLNVVGFCGTPSQQRCPQLIKRTSLTVI
jgi:hypothetical protein